MSQATPELIITNDGLAVASLAMPEGPYIHIVGFRIGSAFGYDPDRNQQSLRGTQLYSDQVQAWNNVGDNTIDVVCRIQPEAGPFQFGEVGLYLADSNGQFSDQSVLFAIATFDEPQTKFSSLGTNVVSSYTFHCLLKLEQSTAVFQIDTSGGDPVSVDQYCWSDVYPPSLSANPMTQIYNVREVNSMGAGSMLITTSDGVRTLQYGAYEEIWPDAVALPTTGFPSPQLLAVNLEATDATTTAVTAAALANGDFVVQNASSTYIEITQAQFGTSRFSSSQLNRDLLIQTHAGFWRSVSSVVESGTNYRLNLNVSNDGTYNNYPLPVVPATGETVLIYSDSLSGRGILYDQIVNPPPIPLATAGTPGLATAGNGIRVDSPGVLSAYGMLQDSANTGTQLTSSRDLNENMPSGVYWMGNNDFPRNMPFSYAAHLYNHNVVGAGGGSDVTQVLYPWNTGGGDGQGNGGLPPYWRQGWTSNGVFVWTSWFPILVNGKQGQPVSPTTVTGVEILDPGNAYSRVVPGRCMWMLNLSDGGGGGNCTVTAVMSAYPPSLSTPVVVGRASRFGGAGYGRWTTMSGLLNSGDSIIINETDWSVRQLYYYYF